MGILIWLAIGAGIAGGFSHRRSVGRADPKASSYRRSGEAALGSSRDATGSAPLGRDDRGAQ